MPLILPEGLPTIELLRQENVLVQAKEEQGPTCLNHVAARKHDTKSNIEVEARIGGTPHVARPLRIAILNLMPMKIATETDLLRVLSLSPLHLEIHLMMLRSHTPKHTPAEHMQAFYRYFHDMRTEHFDGMLITGAPVEHLDYPQVNYWSELEEIFGWCRTNVTSTMYICWAAQAGLYHYYGVPKHTLSQKMFGIFPQTPLQPRLPIFRGFDDTFCMPHSRHTEVRREDIDRVPDLEIVAESPMSGVAVVMAHGGREIFVTGHSEYAPDTLDTEYRRDLDKGLPIRMPYNYYVDDDMGRGVKVTWRAHGNLLFSNWLNYYVNPSTPYAIKQ